jgi:hypothetical protein
MRPAFLLCLTLLMSEGAAVGTPLWGISASGQASASTPAEAGGNNEQKFSTVGFIQQLGYTSFVGALSQGTVLDPIQNVLYDFKAQSFAEVYVAPGEMTGEVTASAGGLYVDPGVQTYSSKAQGEVIADAGYGYWYETFYFVGLPLGTPETFLVSSSFSASLTGATYPGGVHGAQATYDTGIGNCSIFLQVNETTPGGTDSETCPLHVFSGETVDVAFAQISMQANATTEFGLSYAV